MFGMIVTAVLIGLVIGIGIPSACLGLAHIYEQRILDEERRHWNLKKMEGLTKRDETNDNELHQTKRLKTEKMTGGGYK